MPIHIASWNGHVDMMGHFLTRGIDINIRSDHDGETPLHYAAMCSQLRMIDFLVASGADLHSTDHSGATPLSYSRFKSNTGDLATALLLSLGARE